MSRTAQHYQKGFSLLELAIVIGIIALVLAFGINIGSNVMKGSERITTQERLATIQKALDQFAELHGYLPCPARRDYAPSAGFYFGREERDTSNSGQCWISGGGSIQANGVLYGAVPVRTLGLPDAYIADAWSGKFTYAVSNNMVGSIGSFHTENGNLRVVYNDGSSSYPQANQRDAADYGVAYAVISHGRDGRGAYPFAGTAVAVACNAITGTADGYNCDDSDSSLHDSPYNDRAGSPGYFDDYIVWRSNTLSRVPVTNSYTVTMPGCSSSCEEWCATCENAPVGGLQNPMICKKHVISTNPCRSLCIYSYPGSNQLCP